jgi:uncharacterized protein YidB (DUF937 family)
MGLFDGILSQVVGSAMGGTSQGNNPLGSILGSLAGSMGGTQSAGGGGLGGMLGGMLGAGGSSSRGGMGGAASGGMILTAVLAMLKSQGGIGAVLSKLQTSDLGTHAASWVGTGANLPVTGDQLHNALGGDAIGGLAAQLGVDHAQAAGVLSKVLPELINQMSPGGALPDNHDDLLHKGLDMLKGLSART